MKTTTAEVLWAYQKELGKQFICLFTCLVMVNFWLSLIPFFVLSHNLPGLKWIGILIFMAIINALVVTGIFISMTAIITGISKTAFLSLDFMEDKRKFTRELKGMIPKVTLVIPLVQWLVGSARGVHQRPPLVNH